MEELPSVVLHVNAKSMLRGSDTKNPAAVKRVASMFFLRALGKPLWDQHGVSVEKAAFHGSPYAVPYKLRIHYKAKSEFKITASPTLQLGESVAPPIAKGRVGHVGYAASQGAIDEWAKKAAPSAQVKLEYLKERDAEGKLVDTDIPAPWAKFSVLASELHALVLAQPPLGGKLRFQMKKFTEALPVLCSPERTRMSRFLALSALLRLPSAKRRSAQRAKLPPPLLPLQLLPLSLLAPPQPSSRPSSTC